MTTRAFILSLTTEPSGHQHYSISDGSFVVAKIAADNPNARENATLFAFAPDHAMFGHAIASLGARWEALDDKSGEFCIGGIRYATDVDKFGVPVLTSAIRAAIAEAEGAKR